MRLSYKQVITISAHSALAFQNNSQTHTGADRQTNTQEGWVTGSCCKHGKRV